MKKQKIERLIEATNVKSFTKIATIQHNDVECEVTLFYNIYINEDADLDEELTAIDGLFYGAFMYDVDDELGHRLYDMFNEHIELPIEELLIEVFNQQLIALGAQVGVLIKDYDLDTIQKQAIVELVHKTSISI